MSAFDPLRTFAGSPIIGPMEPLNTDGMTPLPPPRRIWALDALRGLALFGVLTINLHTEFRVSLFEQFLSQSVADPADRATATFLSFVFEFKAFALFSMLFGIGLALQCERLARNPRRPVFLMRRLVALLSFGLIHLFLIWNGDILTEYALAGLVAFPLLFMPSRASLIAAILFLAVYIALPWLPLPFVLPDAAWMASHAADARQIYGSGTLLDVLRFRIAEVPHIAKLLIYVFPQTLALIFFGVWLLRAGWIMKLGERRVALLSGALLLIGSRLLLTALDEGYVSLIPVGALVGKAVSVFAPLVTAFGFAALVLAASGSAKARARLQWAVPVGRMAFSNYILQSLMLGLIFYGYGFGLMGKVGAAGGLGIAIVIYTVQAWISAQWLRTHRFGPLEWLWRSIMYGKRQAWGLSFERFGSGPAVEA